MAKLKPAFIKPYGTVTAANSSFLVPVIAIVFNSGVSIDSVEELAAHLLVCGWRLKIKLFTVEKMLKEDHLKNKHKLGMITYL